MIKITKQILSALLVTLAASLCSVSASVITDHGFDDIEYDGYLWDAKFTYNATIAHDSNTLLFNTAPNPSSPGTTNIALFQAIIDAVNLAIVDQSIDANQQFMNCFSPEEPSCVLSNPANSLQVIETWYFPLEPVYDGMTLHTFIPPHIPPLFVRSMAYIWINLRAGCNY